MARLLRLLLGGALAIGLFTTYVSAASAAVFYVNQRGASATCTGKGHNACPKISEAVAQAEKTPGANTIEIQSNDGVEGRYEESIELLSSKDAGLTINGEEAGVEVVGDKAPGFAADFVGTATISDLTVEASAVHAVLTSSIAILQTALTLDDVDVENQASGGVYGIEAAGHSSVTMNGGVVNMENGTTGYGIFDVGGPITLNGVHIVDGGESEAEAGGVYSSESTLAMTNTNVYEETGSGTSTYGIVTERDTSASLQNVLVRQSTPAIGVLIGETPTTADGVHIEMLRSSSNATALLDEDEAGTGATNLSHVEIGGTWIGSGLAGGGGALTLSDSNVTESPTSKRPAVEYDEGGASRGLLIERSVLQAAVAATPAALEVFNGNATTDSSEILGGSDGADLESGAETTETLTLSASTVDAGEPGIASDAAGVQGVQATAKTGAKSVADVSIQGSIVLERQAASVANGAEANISCSYSAAPSQTQSAGGGTGAIACAGGSAGNSEASPLALLFGEPLSGYQLVPTSSALDSVPAGALSLPFGLTPSATDLAGNPRLGDSVDACFTGQDKGALELQGHLVSCLSTTTTTTTATATTVPTTATPKPLAGILTGLTLSPSAFFAAPFGATVSAVVASKKKYGTKISYSDSQAATTTFTVLRKSSGRKHGKSCEKPSPENKHGRRCTLLVKMGTFTHADTQGANNLHFSGRIRGKKLPAGTYCTASHRVQRRSDQQELQDRVLISQPDW
jgi:hypothetical protein